MLKTLTVLTAVVLFASCTSGNPNKRVSSSKPIDEKVECVAPPPTIMTEEVEAKVDAAIPYVKDVLKASFTTTQKYQRIRGELSTLQSVEVMMYRFCIDYRNGIISKERYNELIDEILPLLKKGDTQTASTQVQETGFAAQKPKLLLPPNSASFDHYPRDLTLKWQNLSDAKRYVVELQLQDPTKGTWHLDPVTGRKSVVSDSLKIQFTGAQPGRWRVYAIDSEGTLSQTSDWWEFFFTK